MPLSSQKEMRALALRASIATLIEKDIDPTSISNMLGVSRQTVYLWSKRFRQEGFQAVFGPRDKSEPTSTPATDTQKRILDLTRKKQESGEPYSGRSIAKECGVTHTLVSRIWRRHAIEHPSSKRKQARTKPLPISAPQKFATCKDIAREAGVSVATVSMALNGKRRVNADTAKRIKAIAAKLNYVAEPALKTLVGLRWGQLKRSSSLAYIARFQKEDPINALTTYPNHQLYTGFADRAKALGYSLETYNLTDYPSPKALGRVLYNRGVSGVAIGFMKLAKSDFHDTLLSTLSRFPFSLASFCWSNEDAQKCARFHPDPYKHMTQIVDVLLEHSYRKIAYIGEKAGDAISRIMAAAENRFQKRGSRLAPLMMRDDFDSSRLSDFVRKENPDVLIGRDHHYRHLVKMGYSFPREMAFISREKRDSKDEEIAGIDACLAESGANCANYMDTLIRSHVQGIDDYAPTIHLPSRWIDGASFPGHSKAELAKLESS